MFLPAINGRRTRPRRAGLRAIAVTSRERPAGPAGPAEPVPEPVFRAYELQPVVRAAPRRRERPLDVLNLLNGASCEYQCKVPDMKTANDETTAWCRSRQAASMAPTSGARPEKWARVNPAGFREPRVD